MRAVCLPIALVLVACGPAPADPTPPPVPQISDLRQVIPSDGLPPEVVLQDANNNLDIQEHDGRLFLAFRTAPTHFASEETELYVVSSVDEEDWRFEGRFWLGTDLREPQLVSWEGTLHLFFAVLGTDPLAFEPGGSRHAIWRGPGDWTAPEVVFDVDFIPWRIKPIDGRLSLVGYTGGAMVYDPESDEAIEVFWRASDDGLSWEAAHAGAEVVHRGGASETDLVVREDGSVVAVMRNEAGDEDGFGSKICRAEPDAPGDWRCEPDPRKYDSPLLFSAEDRVWLVARRNLTESGHYDLQMDHLDHRTQFFTYQIDYWQQPKRCALWEVDPEALSVSWVLDLPSRGDTCFPELVERDGERILYNYSSDPDGADLSWLDGQMAPTMIYRQTLSFTAAGAGAP